MAPAGKATASAPRAAGRASVQRAGHAAMTALGVLRPPVIVVAHGPQAAELRGHLPAACRAVRQRPETADGQVPDGRVVFLDPQRHASTGDLRGPVGGNYGVTAGGGKAERHGARPVRVDLTPHHGPRDGCPETFAPRCTTEVGYGPVGNHRARLRGILGRASLRTSRNLPPDVRRRRRAGGTTGDVGPTRPFLPHGHVAAAVMRRDCRPIRRRLQSADRSRQSGKRPGSGGFFCLSTQPRFPIRPCVQRASHHPRIAELAVEQRSLQFRAGVVDRTRLSG
jgi:hypothetical protein